VLKFSAAVDDAAVVAAAAIAALVARRSVTLRLSLVSAVWHVLLCGRASWRMANKQKCYYTITS